MTEPSRPEVQLFDPPLCCPTGLCGPTLDPTLVDVGETILALQAQGIGVARYMMISHPQEYLRNRAVYDLVRQGRLEVLPVTVVRGRVVKTGAYPSLAEIDAALREDASPAVPLS